MAQSPTSYGGETYLPSHSGSSQNGDGRSRLDTARSTEPLVNRDSDDALDPLKPVPGSEDDFKVDNNKFAFSPGQLGKLFPKSNAAFYALGGLAGIETGLRTDRRAGLSVDEKELEGTVSFEDVVQGSAKNSNGDQHPERSHPIRRDTGLEHQDMHHEKSYTDRLRVFGDNRLPEKKSKSLLQLMWMAFNDKMLILLTFCAIVSLVLGIVQSSVASKHPVENDGRSANENTISSRRSSTILRRASSGSGADSHAEWVEGLAILLAVLIVVGVGALNDWQKEKKFVALSKKTDERNVKVIRSGRSREISVFDVVVGDVVHLEPGNVVPCDGVLIQGYGVKCDESSQTGESDIVKKTAGDDAFTAFQEHGTDNMKIDPLIISGSRVQEGTGTFLCTGVGVKSSHGKIMLSLHEESQTTPLQSKLNVLAEWIAKLGAAAGLLLFTVTFFEYVARLARNEVPGDSFTKGFEFVQVLIVAITVIVVAVPEGLPLAVTLALAFATRKMMKENNLVRIFKACETMGNATTICSDKTGTLTQNKMTVVAGTFGGNKGFLNPKVIESVKVLEDGDANDERSSHNQHSRTPSDTSFQTLASAVRDISSEVKEVLKESILINSTAFEGQVDGKDDFIGSKTEAAMLNFARQELSMGPLDGERANRQVVQVDPFDSKRKCMGTTIKLSQGGYRLYVKGASEIMLAKCKFFLKDPESGLTATELAPDNAEAVRQTIDGYAEKSLRTLGLIYRDFESWPPKGYANRDGSSGEANLDKMLHDMTFLGLLGIQDPLRPGIAESVAICQKAGVTVRMVTGDNVLTARAIAKEAGILTEDGMVLEGPDFRQMSKAEMHEKIPHLQVLARSSPEDKRILAKRLMELGETVAVTGDGTNDAPALKTADVGFAMGITGTEMAKEASDIILLDDNFNSIVNAMMWGRCVNDAVKKFLQFQVTVNITAVLLTFISAVTSPTQDSVLSAVQLLWLNLIMDTFAALALATDPPAPSILDRMPERKDAPLITFNMWKMMVGQSIYQLAVTLGLYYGGSPYDQNASLIEQATLIFNTFVWMQIFNQYNCRRLDNNFNIVEGIHRNFWFLGIQALMVGLQVMIVFVGGSVFSIAPLSGMGWVYSLVFGVGSLVVGIFLKLIPDEALRKVTDPVVKPIGARLSILFKKSKSPEISIEDAEAQVDNRPKDYQWNPDLEHLKDELLFIKRMRGGRLQHFRWQLQHPVQAFAQSRSPSRSRKASVSNASSTLPRTPTNELATDDEPTSPMSLAPQSPRRGRRSRSGSAFGPAAAMAGVVAGSIAGWSPVEVQPEDRMPSMSRSRRNTGVIEEDAGEVEGQKDQTHRHKNSTASLAPPTAAHARSQRSNSTNTLAPPPFERD